MSLRAVGPSVPLPHLAMFSFVFCLFLSASSLNAEPNPSRVDGDLLMRNWLFRPYLEVPAFEQQQQKQRLIAVPAKDEQHLPLILADPLGTEAALWRNRRAPLIRPSTRRLSDQYTPTPCRWKLCASFLGGAAAFAFR
ncbi:hypothetical protein niasHS_002354 [Heterodera schachtii]